VRRRTDCLPQMTQCSANTLKGRHGQPDCYPRTFRRPRRRGARRSDRGRRKKESRQSDRPGRAACAEHGPPFELSSSGGQLDGGAHQATVHFVETPPTLIGCGGANKRVIELMAQLQALRTRTNLLLANAVKVNCSFTAQKCMRAWA